MKANNINYVDLDDVVEGIDIRDTTIIKDAMINNSYFSIGTCLNIIDADTLLMVMDDLDISIETSNKINNVVEYLHDEEILILL